MNRPGDYLRAFAARTCSDDTMARLVDPAIADLQAEYSQAVRDGRKWLSRWVRLVGYIAFAKVFVLCEWSPIDDARPLTRAVCSSLIAIALVTALLFWSASSQWLAGASSQLDAWRLVPFLLPQALGISIPVGVMIGVATGLAGQRISARLAMAVGMMAVVCSIGSAANLDWLLPHANQAFRITIARRIGIVPSPRGESELTLAELDRLIERRGGSPVGSYEWNISNRARISYHMRWALPFATLALTLFAMSLVACTRRRWAIGAGIVAAIFGYYMLIYLCRVLALSHDLVPPVAAWLPNAAFTLLSVALMAFRERRPEFAR